MDVNGPFQKALARQLLALGAFLVRPASGAGGDYLHHLPLRSFGHEPRLACVDLLDTLLLWESGREAWLHLIPADPDVAAAYLEAAGLPTTPVRGLDLRCHVDSALDGVSIEQMSRLADLCLARLLSPDGDMIVTSSRRLDGVAGTADLLLVS